MLGGLQQYEVHERFRQSRSAGSKFKMGKRKETQLQRHTSAHKQKAWCFHTHNPPPNPFKKGNEVKCEKNSRNSFGTYTGHLTIYY